MYNGNGGSLSVSETVANNGFQVFPNPADDCFKIRLESKELSEPDLIIRDITGKVIRSQRLYVMPGANEWLLDVGTAHAGIYMIQIGNGQAQRLIIY